MNYYTTKRHKRERENKKYEKFQRVAELRKGNKILCLHFEFISRIIIINV